AYVFLWIKLQRIEPTTARNLPEMAAYCGRSLSYYFLLLALPTPKWMHTFTLDSLEALGIWSVLLGFICAAILVWLIFSYKRHPATAWFAAATLVLLLPALNFVKAAVFPVTPYRADAAGACAAAIFAWAIVRFPANAVVRGLTASVVGAFFLG